MARGRPRAKEVDVSSIRAKGEAVLEAKATRKRGLDGVSPGSVLADISNQDGRKKSPPSADPLKKTAGKQTRGKQTTK